MAKTSILFISTELPFPPSSGGTMKSWNYIKDLSKRYQVSLACLLKNGDSAYLEKFQQSIQIENLYTQNIAISRSPLNLLKSYFGFPSLNVFRNYNPSLKEKIAAVAKNHDAIIVDHYEVFQYVPKNYQGKIILHTHNAEFMLWQRMAELSKNPLIKSLLKLESLRVKKYEKHIFKLADLIYSSPSDIECYNKHGFQTERHQYTYHLGNDQLIALPSMDFDQTEHALSFMGTLTWEPNVDALLWFIKSIWPQIIEKCPGTKLYVMGKKGDPRIYEAAASYPNIIFTGFVKNLDQYLKKTRVYIAPLRFGSGMKVKVLEGLYRGVPMVSTSVGAEGLSLKQGRDILIADEENQFATDCIQLLKDKAKWEELSRNSRAVAKEKYQWEPLFEKMDLKLKQLLR